MQVSGRYTQSIAETLVAEPDWPRRHWDSVRQSYAGAAAFAETAPFLEELYATVPGPSLADVNRHFLVAIAARLGIATPLTASSRYEPAGRAHGPPRRPLRQGRRDRVRVGPGGEGLPRRGGVRAAGISVSWFRYGPYREYEQPHPPYDPRASIVDLLLCAGAAAAELVRPADTLAR